MKLSTILLTLSAVLTIPHCLSNQIHVFTNSYTNFNAHRSLEASHQGHIRDSLTKALSTSHQKTFDRNWQVAHGERCRCWSPEDDPCNKKNSIDLISTDKLGTGDRAQGGK
ncbi:MAG: hypothetical protein CL816_07565 [Coxiellaceae bacterium]|nr:hypothetical protein [Coxiellaceae bacterium]|tara:strand:- start:692 stop:1024 length:333 start_codon:yes stop_codon:yes gene_type:complete